MTLQWLEFVQGTMVTCTVQTLICLENNFITLQLPLKSDVALQEKSLLNLYHISI